MSSASLSGFLAGVRKGVEGAVDTVAGASETVVNLNLVYMAMVPGLLFLILTPGFILNVGGLSKGRCSKLVPLPDTATGTCDTGSNGYISGGATDPFDGDEEDLFTLCTAQRKCRRWFVSGYTGPWPIALHTLVFMLLVGALSYTYSYYY